MIACSVSAFIGRVAFSYFSDALGRRISGVLFGLAAAVLIILASYLRNEFLGVTSVFWLVLVLAYFFADGGLLSWDRMPPKCGHRGCERAAWARRMASGESVKIDRAAGAGSDRGLIERDQARGVGGKIVPAFIYLGGWYALAGIVYGLFGIETRHRTIAQIDRELGVRCSPHAATARLF